MSEPRRDAPTTCHRRRSCTDYLSLESLQKGRDILREEQKGRDVLREGCGSESCMGPDGGSRSSTFTFSVLRLSCPSREDLEGQVLPLSSAHTVPHL